MAKVIKRLAKTMKLDRISSIWIIPIITLMIGVWMIYSHFAEQGINITLLASDANGIVAGKTVIKSRSVNVGVVESVTLSKDFNQVVIKGQMYKDMDPLIKNDTVFWLVKPQIGRGGISGLETLLSGVYIEMIPGNEDATFKDKPFKLSNNPPVSSPNALGIRINLNSSQDGVIPVGAPVMFRGYTVGNVETSEFDVASSDMKYQLFIHQPYDKLITKNVKFWKEGGVNLSLSSKGASLKFPSLDVLMSGGISFDVPEGLKAGKPAQPLSTFNLYENKKATENIQYTNFQPFLLFFSESISGLSEGAPVEYRGIRIGTVMEVPFYNDAILKENTVLSFSIPVLIHIEPGRLSEFIDQPVDLSALIIQSQNKGLRASLKSSNFFTGSLYVDLDFYSDLSEEQMKLSLKEFGYDTIATISTGLSQLQSKLGKALDNFNQLPLDHTINELNNSLVKIQKLLDSVNKITSSKDMQNLPKDFKQTLGSLNRILQSIQPGSALHSQLSTDMKKFEGMMEQLTPLLNTLNDKSNALIFAAPAKTDPQPKAKGN